MIARIAKKWPETVHFALLPASENTLDRRKQLYSWNIYPLFFSSGQFERVDRFLAFLAAAAVSRPEGRVDPIVVANIPHAQAHTLPQTFAALLAAVREPKGSITLSPGQITELVQHQPRDLTEYRLARIAEWSRPRYHLDRRFVGLTLLIDQGEDARGARWVAPENRRFTDLREVVRDRADDPVLVLLGAPGSGKSTLLRRFQLDTAIDVLRGGDERVSFFASLNDYKIKSVEPREWLNAEWALIYPDLPKLDSLLERGKVVLLLDALNEMEQGAEAPYKYDDRVRLWSDFIRSIVRQGNRALFSCRSLDYSTPLTGKDLPVPQVVVQPMDDAQLQSFLQVYLPDRAEHAWRELEGTPQLDLYRTPFFLKLLCGQIEVHGTVPKGRASLFTGFVRQVLKREIAGDNALFKADSLLTERDRQKLANDQWWANPFELPEYGTLIPSLSKLAYVMQEKGLGREAAQVRIADRDACRLLAGNRPEETAEVILKAGIALNVLDEDRRKEEILFFHQLLQEFFAARKLARDPRPELVRLAWRKGGVSPMLEQTLATLGEWDPLPLLPQTGWEETTLLASVMARDPAAFIRALIDLNLPLAARCMASPEIPPAPDFERHIQGALIKRTQDASADLRARIAAGLALGNLGDPRFERCRGPHGDYLLPPLATIAAGEYAMGSDEGLYEDEAPAHTMRLEAFQIGVFPVTNAEYALFIAASGYEDERWWETPAAKDWRRREGKTQPTIWRDESFNNPAQPVVEVSWYEARAYCAWLSAQAGRTFRLPSEAEFEAAARGRRGRRYPYGQKFDGAQCNTFESHIRRTTPVGIFRNATPEGVFDLSGNAYTWTSSAYQPYPYRAGDGREDVHRTDLSRVVRGGSWSNYQIYARAAARHYYLPADGPLYRFSGCWGRPFLLALPAVALASGLWGSESSDSRFARVGRKIFTPAETQGTCVRTP